MHLRISYMNINYRLNNNDYGYSWYIIRFFIRLSNEAFYFIIKLENGLFKKVSYIVTPRINTYNKNL